MPSIDTHFRSFLETLDQTRNETQVREAFVILAARGFDDSQFAKELALGAEYQRKFRTNGLVRRGAADAFYGNLIIEFEYDLQATYLH